MKKIVLIVICFITTFITVEAINKGFNLNINKIFESESRTNKVNSLLNKEYAIDYKEKENKNNEEYEQLTKKVTYLLLGDGDISNESASEYLKRKKDCFDMIYSPEIPKAENNPTGLDTNSKEYQDNSYAGYVIPQMFNLMNSYNVRYNYLGEIKTAIVEDGFMSKITIPNAILDMSNEEKPREYKQVKENLVMFYIFKKQGNDYKLYYAMGETNDDVEEYLEDKTNQENNQLNSKLPNISSMSSLYDYSKLNSLSDKKINDIYNANLSKTMLLKTYYDKSVIDSASGFMLTKDILVTSWSYLKNSLMKGQFVQVHDSQNNLYELDGVVSINEDADIALLKINGYNGNGVILGKTDNLNKEDPVISLGSKSGINISYTTGIIITTDGKIQSLIPITDYDAGGPLINTNGEVVGVNTRLSTNSSVSYATKIDVLRDMQSKLSTSKDIKVSSFQTLKEHYYYHRNNEENIKNSIKDEVWKEFSKIGNLEKNVALPLVKVSYKNDILSLRYKNEITQLFTNEMIANRIGNSLKKDKFKEVLNIKNKKIYEDKKYKVIIMDEFNYLIVVMVRK